MTQAIITGDIIQSTKMTVVQRNRLFSAISNALKQWDKDYKMRSETFRGDSFQCHIQNPVLALRISLLLKTYIRSIQPVEQSSIRIDKQKEGIKTALTPTYIFDARIAIGMGNIEYLSKRLATSSGVAFELSGQLLDSLKHKKQTLAIATNDRYNDELKTEFTLLDALISKTTALQCQVISYKLLGYTEHQIAPLLNIQQSAVNQRSNNGNWNAIEAMLNRFEQIYAHE
jgi:hypothetical protein